MRYPVSVTDLGHREKEAVLSALDRNWITQGQEVASFERSLANFLDVPPSMMSACSSGTAALHLALVSLGIGPGDEVLVPDLTYVATYNAVLYTGAKPVLVDIHEDDWNIDLRDAGNLVTPRTRAILPVHLYGVPCDMTGVLRFARENNLFVIEDAAEALGATWEGHPCGTIGDAGVFSFYGNKLITCGEGGAVFSAFQSDRVRLLRGQGQDPRRRFWHLEMGFNYRMSDLHAAVGNAQLASIGRKRLRRELVWNTYWERLSTTKEGPLTLQSWKCHDNTRIAPWLFTGLLPRRVSRGKVMDRLEEMGVETRPTFVPLHQLPYIREANRFPVATDVGERGISLPTSSTMAPMDAADISMYLLEALS